MAGFTRSIVIAKPVEEVFDFATNVANAARMMPNVTKVEMLTDGGMRPGARFRETRLMRGKGHSAVIEVIEHVRPQVHTARSAMMGMSATYTFRFAPDSAGTRVEMIADVQGNFLWWPFLGMMARMMEKEDGAYLTHLRAALQAS